MAKTCLMGFLMFVFFLSNANAQDLLPQDEPNPYSNFSFIRFVDPSAPALEPLSDEEFLDKAGKVVFRVNRFDVFTNDSLLAVLEKEVLPMVNRDSLRLVRMVLRGAASPEGPFRNNQMLGRRRVQTLYGFLRERLTVPVDENTTEIEAVSEDYRLLLAMMRRAGDHDADLVQRLCDRHLPHDEYTLLKNKLKLVHGGELWRRLLKTYFPQLRAARLVLFFEKATPTEISEKTEPTEKIDSLERLDSLEQLEILEPLEPTEALDSIWIRLPRREVLAVKTNLLLYGAYVPGYDRWCPIPNVAVEFYPLHGHFTVGASFDCPWWQHYQQHKFFQIRNYQVEGRYYLRSGDINKNLPGQGPAFRGWYFSAYGHLGLFGICFDENHGWEGEGLGGGVGVGYVQRLGKKGHWRLEFAAQAGFMRCGYDPYQYENPVNPAYHDGLYYYKWASDPDLFKKRQYRFSWLGPTRVGVTLSYDLLYRRLTKRGVSFRSWEKKKVKK